MATRGDPWSGVPLNAKGSELGKGTEKDSVHTAGSFVDPERQRQKGKGKGGEEKGGSSQTAPMAVDATFPSQSSVPCNMSPPPWTAPTPMPAEHGDTIAPPWGHPSIYGPGFGFLGQTAQGSVPPTAPVASMPPMPHGGPPGLTPQVPLIPCFPGAQPWVMPDFAWLQGQPVTGTPAATSSNGSWSKPTGSDPAPKPSKKKEATKVPSNAPGGDPMGSEPEDPDDDASQKSSSAATSDIKSMLKRRLRQEDGYHPKSSLGSVKVEEFYGDRTRYLKWKHTIQAQQHLYACLRCRGCVLNIAELTRNPRSPTWHGVRSCCKEPHYPAGNGMTCTMLQELVSTVRPLRKHSV